MFDFLLCVSVYCLQCDSLFSEFIIQLTTHAVTLLARIHRKKRSIDDTMATRV